MIERFVAPKITELLTFFHVVGIIGPGQAGKTTLVKELSNRLDKPSLYPDLENPGDDVKLSDPILFFPFQLKSYSLAWAQQGSSR